MTARYSRRTGLTLAALLALAVMLISVSPAHALERRTGTTVDVPRGEIVDGDLLVAATDFTMNGIIEGDLFVVANTIVINGDVHGDVFALASDIAVEGALGDDALMAAVFTSLGRDSSVYDDITVATVGFQQKRGSEVGGDLTYLGIYGSVKGVVGGSKVLETGGSAAAESFGRAVAQYGDTVFAALVRPAVPYGALDARYSVTAQDDEAAETSPTAIDWLAAAARRWVAVLLFGALFLWFRPHRASAGIERLKREPIKSFLWGIIAIPALIMIGMIITFATVVAVMAERALTLDELVWFTVLAGVAAMLLLVLAAIALTSYLGYVVVGYLLGHMTLARVWPEGNARAIVPVALGTLVVVILTMLPYVGPALSTIMMLLGLGALTLLWRDDLVRRWAPDAPDADGADGDVAELRAAEDGGNASE